MKLLIDVGVPLGCCKFLVIFTTALISVPYKHKKVQNVLWHFSQVRNGVYFLWRDDAWHGVMTIFLLTTRKMQKTVGLRSDNLFFRRTPYKSQKISDLVFYFEISIVKRRHHKAWATTFSQKPQGTFLCISQRLSRRWKVRGNTCIEYNTVLWSCWLFNLIAFLWVPSQSIYK